MRWLTVLAAVFALCRGDALAAPGPGPGEPFGGDDAGTFATLSFQPVYGGPAYAVRNVVVNVAHEQMKIGNNLFVGPAVLSGTRVVDWLGPIDNGIFENDGWFPDGGFRFNFAPGGLVSFVDFAALQAGGIETSGVLLTQPIFANGLAAPASYAATLSPADVTPAARSEAVDAAAPLPNLNDIHQGPAADLGAIERGCTQPIYGIRPEGIDESNEPLGCGS